MTIRQWLRQNLQSDDQAKNPTEPAGWSERCPSCGTPISEASTPDEAISHNFETCRLVNLVLSELGVSFGHSLRVEIYPGAGPLRGFYFTADPYTIHISESAYSDYREYIIFHETKHLVDCLTLGQSEEVTPDRFARYLCGRYGYRCPPDNLVSGVPYA
jgi:hypothetical protein